MTNPDTFGIYRISEKNNYLKKIIEVKERSSRSIFSNLNTSNEDNKRVIRASYLTGPYNILFNNNKIYFALDDFDDQSSGNFLREFNLYDNNVKQIMEKTLDSFDNFLYAVYKDKIYIYFRENEEPGSGIYEIKKQMKINNENFQKTTTFIGFRENSQKILMHVQGIRFNSKGELFIIDSEKNIIWKMLPENNKLIRFVGSGKEGFKDGQGEKAEFNLPKNIDFDKYDNLYLTDNGNNAIRKITPEGVVTTFYFQYK